MAWKRTHRAFAGSSCSTTPALRMLRSALAVTPVPVGPKDEDARLRGVQDEFTRHAAPLCDATSQRFR